MGGAKIKGVGEEEMAGGTPEAAIAEFGPEATLPNTFDLWQRLQTERSGKRNESAQMVTNKSQRASRSARTADRPAICRMDRLGT
jgi:hypothetical protein